MCLQYKSFENTAGKGEIACNEQFLLFPQCFLPFWKTCCYFHQSWNCRLLSLSVWKSLKSVAWERVKSRANNSRSSDPIRSIIKLIWNLKVIIIFTKFGADWSIFVDARVWTRKCEGTMDGQRDNGHRRTVSDHNSSLWALRAQLS